MEREREKNVFKLVTIINEIVTENCVPLHNWVDKKGYRDKGERGGNIWTKDGGRGIDTGEGR